jgi:putative endonuclease
MAKTRDIGAQGEALAREYLEQKGYRFLAANWQCKAGELDLIMLDPAENCRVVVEVRLRRATTYGQGDETVAWQKQKKLLRTIAWYQQQTNYWDDIRCDIISIEVKPDGGCDVHHIDYAVELG